LSDATSPPKPPPPRCPRCGAPLARAPVPRSAFGIEGEACFDCDDASPARQQPWACPACGGVYLLDTARLG
jgi:hypothetical protein